MNFKALALTAVTALTLAAPATAGLRELHFNPPAPTLDQCEAFEASADWVEKIDDRFKDTINRRSVKGNTVYLGIRNSYSGGCLEVRRIANLGESFERGGIETGSGEYHMESGSLVFYTVSKRWGRQRNVLEVQN